MLCRPGTSLDRAGTEAGICLLHLYYSNMHRLRTCFLLVLYSKLSGYLLAGLELQLDVSSVGHLPILPKPLRV